MQHKVRSALLHSDIVGAARGSEGCAYQKLIRG